jgi:hypothetical protein
MSKGKLLEIYFKNINLQKLDRFKYIKVESALYGIVHNYIFTNGILDKIILK